VFCCKNLNDVEVFCSPTFWQLNEKICVDEHNMHVTDMNTRYSRHNITHNMFLILSCNPKEDLGSKREHNMSEYLNITTQQRT
jgi:hypothetical protein